MATKVNAKDVADNTEEANDAPLAGQGNIADAVKKLLKKGKERGVVTLDELNAVLPPERISSEFIEDVMAQLNDMGINVVESEDESDGEAPAEGAEATTEAAPSEDYGRTDDPVRLYLREMGAVELLSREGEIAIAKRIEAGREMMIAGICDSPLTIQAILDWNEALKEGRLLLRDIIDLDATQTPDGTTTGPLGSAAEGLPSAGSGELAEVAGAGDKATDEAAESEAEGEGDGDGLSSFDDEDNISLAAIEEKLKPQVIETFDKIAATYSKLGKLQHQRLLAIEKGEEPNRSAEGKIDGYRTELVELVRTIRFNNARLEQLVQQLYTLNRRLMGLEGRLLRLAVDVGLGRDDFLERYYGHEHDPRWFEHILELPPVPEPAAPKPVSTPRPTRADPKAAERAAREAAKLENQRKAAELKLAKQAASAQAKADKAAAAEQAKADKETAREAARLARDKEAVAKQARLEADREKAAKLKIKEAEAKQRELDKKRAAADKAAAQKQRERDKLAAAREKAAAAKQRERDKAQAARDKAAAARQRELDKKRGVTAKAKPKPAAKKAPAKAPAKKAAPKKAPAKPVKKPAGKPAKKMAVKSAQKSSKPAAKKTAKPVKKPAAKKPAPKGKKR